MYVLGSGRSLYLDFITGETAGQQQKAPRQVSYHLTRLADLIETTNQAA